MDHANSVYSTGHLLTSENFRNLGPLPDLIRYLLFGQGWINVALLLLATVDQIIDFHTDSKVYIQLVGNPMEKNSGSLLHEENEEAE